MKTFHHATVAALTLWLIGLAPGPTWAQTPAAAEATTPAVRTSTLSSIWVFPEREAPARVVARNESRLSFEVAGTLLRWHADVGSTVRQGDLLAEIDPRDFDLAVRRAQTALDAAQARLALAQAQLQRSRDLVAQGFFSQEALAQRETEVQLLQADVATQQSLLATAQRQRDKTRLRAPFAASVKQRLAQTGEAVSPGGVLYVLSETGGAEVLASVTPADAPSLRAARERWLLVDGQRHALGRLQLSPTVDTPARTQAARLSLPDSATAPASGSSGSLRWRDARPHLPPAQMVRRGDALGLFVQVGEGTEARARFVALPGAQEGRAAALPASLGASMRVITTGQAGLADGESIRLDPATR